jgi:multidrug efflux pump subunit AcrA (membrane-fusion protein)
VKSKRAHLAAAKAEVEAYRVEKDLANRDLDRLVVRSPIDGVVLRREGGPGSVVGPSVMPRAEATRTDSGMGGIVSLYDPTKVQARVDVLFASAGGISAVGPGRRAEITTDALPGRTFHGVVTRVVSEADALKASLQVKVRIEDPDPLLRPETIVTARFLADEKTGTSPATAVRILVPRRAVKGDAVFVVDPRGGGRARRVPVRKLGEEGDWIEVEGDLSATHHAILDDVLDGQRVTETSS